ncbi:MAG TPA: cytochrome b [Allosphingosinicella sp.]|uniref:cytochrome b n=1 Tax=Allosphingosinicella sp. TaxID=2823234 RepID=UPI002EDAF972
MASAADPTGQSALRYSRGAMWFHWIIAALVILNLFLGFFYEAFGKDWTPWIMFFHKATGITVLGLSIARLLWRLGHRPPPFDGVLRPWEALLARLTHWLFYVLMIVIPLTGWALSSSSGRPTNYFGLFEIGLLPVPRTDAAHDLFEDAHEFLGKLMIGLILLHVAGAVKHHLQGHRHLIGRMGPWLYRQR